MRLFLVRYSWWDRQELKEEFCSDLIIATSYTAALRDVEDDYGSGLVHIEALELEFTHNDETGTSCLSIPEEAGAAIMSSQYNWHKDDNAPIPLSRGFFQNND